MRRVHSKQIIPFSTAVLSTLFIYLGLTEFGFWEALQGPKPGFVPTIISFIMLVISILAIIQSFKETAPVYPQENLLVILGAALIIGFTVLIGLIPSICIYVVAWLKWLEKCTWKQTLTVLLVIMGIVLGVFVFWLQVPFPKGLLFETILS